MYVNSDLDLYNPIMITNIRFKFSVKTKTILSSVNSLKTNGYIIWGNKAESTNSITLVKVLS